MSPDTGSLRLDLRPASAHIGRTSEPRFARLAQLRAAVMQLPEVTEAPHFHYGAWRERGKIFVTLPPGDKFMHLFAGEAARDRALAPAPEACKRLIRGGRLVGLLPRSEHPPSCSARWCTAPGPKRRPSLW